jgi:hypothetical protein
MALLAMGDSGSRPLAEDQQAQAVPKQKPATRRAAPTDAERARMTKLMERDREWARRTAADLTAIVNQEREEFRRRQAAELEARNQQTRAEIASRLEAARAESRRLEIGAEAAQLLRQSKSASPAERARIERRAEQLIEELKRLKAAPVPIRKDQQ